VAAGPTLLRDPKIERVGLASHEGGAMGDYNRFLLDLLHDESGQDLVEYALVVAIMALGAAATMRSLASAVGSALSSIGSRLTSNV
jgi:pilus assembly protein Flp/PilA